MMANSENDDMQPVFVTQMDRLLLPAYLLTGSHEQAADCLLEACNDSAPVHPAVEQDAFLAAKKPVVHAAVRRIVPGVAKYKGKRLPDDPPEVNEATFSRLASGRLQLDGPSFRHALMSLDVFQRAALVLRLYEGYSALDAAFLLRVPLQTLENTWRRGLLRLLKLLSAVLVQEPMSTGQGDGIERGGCWHPANLPA